MKKRILSLIFSFMLFAGTFLLANANETEINNTKETKENYSTILFTELANTDSEYEILKNANIAFADENFKKTKAKVNLSSAGEYVDAENFISKNDISFVENESIYFDNIVFTQFINEDGETKVVASKFVLPNNYSIALQDTEIKTSDNLEDIFKQDKDVLISPLQNTEVTYKNDFEYEPFLITDKAYLENISDIILNIMKTPYEELDEKMQNKINIYFADNCYQMLNNNKQLSDDITLSTDYILSGKTDTNLLFKDRILMQITATENEKTVSTRILFKLDENNKIYNINILDI